MSLIKAADPLARRARPPPFRAPVVLPAPAHEPALTAAARDAMDRRLEGLAAGLEELEAESAELKAQLAASRADLAQAAEDLKAAVAEAQARGHDAGLEAGSAVKAEAMELLDESLTRAVERLQADLKGLETLAVALAKAGLAKVFGEHEDLSDRMARLIRRQLEELEKETLLRVEVSAEDFADAAALEALGGAAGLQGVEIKALVDLARGDCRLRLSLGDLEVGVAQQWSRLSGLLDEALAPVGPPARAVAS